MGVSKHDIFGDGTGENATNGSYGRRPTGYRLPDALRLGGVRLQVSDLSRSLDYYQNVLGLRVIDRAAGEAHLGPAGTTEPLVELVEKKGASPAPRRGRTGLFHFAILLPDRPALGRFIQHLADIGAQAGAADHLVSEAFYLQDPDNLGIEVYRDRPRAEWRRKGNELMMATDPVDAVGIVESAAGQPWDGAPAGTKMGHLHLHVGDIEAAGAFYSGALGYDQIVWEYPGALFMSAGGYHHHLGTNIWAGTKAEPPAPDQAQLLEWRMVFPEEASRESSVVSLESAGHRVVRESDGVLVRDPWGTPLRLMA